MSYRAALRCRPLPLGDEKSGPDLGAIGMTPPDREFEAAKYVRRSSTKLN
jgi:hypothetical protein